MAPKELAITINLSPEEAQALLELLERELPGIERQAENMEIFGTADPETIQAIKLDVKIMKSILAQLKGEGKA